MGRGSGLNRQKRIGKKVGPTLTLFPNERVRVVPARRIGRVVRPFGDKVLIAFDRDNTLGVFEPSMLRHLPPR